MEVKLKSNVDEVNKRVDIQEKKIFEKSTATWRTEEQPWWAQEKNW